MYITHNKTKLKTVKNVNKLKGEFSSNHSRTQKADSKGGLKTFN